MKNKINIIIIILRTLGIVNSISLALYIFLTSRVIALFKADILEQAYIGITVLIISASILILNILAESKLYSGKGWVTDGIAAVLTIIILIYFSYIAEPKILKWLMPLGVTLPIPTLLSAITSFSLYRKNN